MKKLLGKGSFARVTNFPKRFYEFNFRFIWQRDITLKSTSQSGLSQRKISVSYPAGS